MNNNYLEKLEFNKIKEILSTFSCTYIGKEYCANLFPTNIKEDVKYSLKETQEAVNLISKNSCPSFYEIADISINLKNLESNNTLSIKSLLELTTILKLANELKEYFNKDFIENNDYPILCNLFIDLYSNKNIIEKINLCIIDENTIDDKASKSLSSIRKKQKNLEQDIRNKLSQMIHSSTYSKFIQDSLVTIRNDRFVIPVKEEYRSQIKGFVHDISNAGSTVFIEPISIFEMNNELNQLKIDENIEIEKILKDLSSLFYPYIEQLKMDSDLIGKLDFIFAKAKFSNSLNAITPIINDKKEINLINARHPLIDINKVVPISVNIGNTFSVLLITGPNTGGKTVTLKNIGLLSCMACSGLNIPADEHSSIYVFDEIYTDIGDDQSISDSLSTFSSHMTNIVEITKKVTQNSLVLVDELGSGTDPIEGANLAISILEFFKNKKCITIATTHYQELKQYALVTNDFENASVEFDVNTLSPTYKLLVGIPGKSNAFAISKKLGLSDNIINKAKSLMSSDAVNIEELLKTIYDDKSLIEKEKEEIQKQLNQINLLRKSLERDNSLLKQQELDLINNAKTKARNILLDAKEEATNIIKQLNNSKDSNQINTLRNKLNTDIKNIKITNSKNSSKEHIPSEEIKPNMEVYIPTFTKNGIILSHVNKSNEVQVQIGNIKTNININNIEKISTSNKTNETSNTNLGYTKISKTKNIKSEINVIGLNVEEAIFVVDKFLDDCSLVKLQNVRIVHGKGTGKLRTGIHSFLKNNPHVKSFRLGTYGEGEMGVTVVELKK
mgnify:FL=1